jgi:starvation-inducible DNA-binding protein
MEPLIDFPLDIKPEYNSYEAVVKILNTTLADEVVLGTKTRSAHWNVHGAGFFDRRKLFDVQYKQLNQITDDISKRAQVLGGQPIGSFTEFLRYSRLAEHPGKLPDLNYLLADHEAVIGFLREDTKKCVEELGDEVTRDFLMDILGRHEKMACMLRSTIEPEMTTIENQGNKVKQD